MENEKVIQSTLDKNVLGKQLYKILSNLTLDEFVSLMTNIYDETIQYANLTNGAKSCQKMSLLFNPHRLKTDANKRKNIYESLKDESFCIGLARATLWKKDKVKELLYQVIQLGVNGTQYINEFPPHVARNICKEYDVNKNDIVLDPCAGWGGRLIGISVISNKYIGYEPFTKTYDGLIKLGNYIKILNEDFNFKIINKPFEDSSLKKICDFAITSPPYYDTEIYTDEETNSLNRYKTFDDWCKYFFEPLINKTMSYLKSDGVFILNIGNRKYPLSEKLFDICKNKYKIQNKGNYLSGKSGLRKEDDGEIFYEIRKNI